MKAPILEHSTNVNGKGTISARKSESKLEITLRFRVNGNFNSG